MHRPDHLLLLFLVAFLLPPAHAATDHPSDPSSGQRLTLNVYLDSAGKALVTGYAESISGLDFLNGSQFRLENDSHQLYALTAGLTAKEGDLWTLRFDAAGGFDDYRVTFYLPRETSLGEINISQGLGYLLSASNESMVADVQGWEVSDPRISIQYRQPLASNGNTQLPAPPAYPGEGAAFIVLVIAAALMIAGFGFAVFLQRKRRGSPEGPLQAAIETTDEEEGEKDAGVAKVDRGATAQREDSQGLAAQATRPSVVQAPSMSDISIQPDSSSPNDSSLEDGVVFQRDESPAAIANELEDHGNPSHPTAQPSDFNELPRSGEDTAAPGAPLSQDSFWDGSTAVESPSLVESGDKPLKNVIVVSSEMDAVMQTLTARERSVMSTLISHGGRMTQAEIRYETGTPKSSLTGILISLERRKLVIKKEWGRTNIIELSDWFLSKKERS